MNPAGVVNLILVLLNQGLALLAEIKGQGGLTDDQILAQAQTLTAGNDTAYQNLVAALQGSGVVANPAPSATS